jgi:hypothetical protein
MAMDKINGSPLARPGGLEKFLGTARSEKDDKADKPGSEAAAGTRSAPPADTMEISDAAHRLVDLRQAVETGRKAMDALPDIREDKVEEARKRLAQGYYNSPEVVDKIAGKLGSVFSKIEEI